jgi:hypothetical protein
MWNASIVVPAVPIPVLPPPLPLPADSVPLAGQRIAVLGQGGAARAVVAELRAKGATAMVHQPGHQPGHQHDRAARDAAVMPLDGLLILLPRTPKPTPARGRRGAAPSSIVSDAIATAVTGMTAMLRSPRWLLVLTPTTAPADVTRAVVALGT